MSYSTTIYTTSGFPYGGAPESFVRSMALGLKKNNVKVIIRKIRGDKYENKFNDTGVKDEFVFLKRRPKLEIIKLIELLVLIIIFPISVFKSKYRDKSNHIILFGLEYAYFIIPILLAAKLTGQKVFRIITDDYPISTIKPQWWKFLKQISYKIQYKYIDRKLDGVVCLSYYLYNKCLQNNVSKKRLLIIPHFINPENFKTSDTPRRGDVSDVIRIGYAGALIDANGIIDLFEAFIIVASKYHNIELLVAGDLSNTSEETKNHINNLKNKFAEKAIFPGMVDSKKVPVLLQTCDILVNPRKSSLFAEAGFPTKVGEYFACKRPVVATRVGDIGYYFNKQNELLLAEPDNPSSIADCIMNLIQSPEKRESLSKKGYEWMISNLEYQKSAQKLISFIEEQ